ncbi:MAG TPA: PKD domain-containing protein, partial [Gammaproteobacteria bacterium]|nr:PKD domain-containing protein [Gammaproteobacteria bacterium]
EAPFDDSGTIFCIEIFLPEGDCHAIYERVGRMHDFDPGPGVDLYQKITIPEDTVLNVALQWDAPFGGPGPDNDHDIVLLSESGGTYFAISANDNVTTREGWELLQFENAEVLGWGESFSLIITYDDVDSQGPPATLLKMIVFGSATLDEYQTHSSTLMGHANAAGAQTVGAAFFEQTPEFGVSPPLAEPYSSAGGTPILFNTNGSPRTVAHIRAKPEITAVDGVNTTFFFSDLHGNDGIDDFFGTSAAAPHAAGVAALLLEARPGATPTQIGTALQSTAIDMNTPGFDFDTGAGLIQADAAIGALLAAGGNTPPVAGFSVVETGLLVDFTDTSSDIDGSITAWEWDFGDGNGSSDQHPMHTYGEDGDYTVTLTVTDDAEATDTASALLSLSNGGSGNLPPSAAFSYSCNSTTCDFDGSASSDDGVIASYLWDFGDGVSGSGPAPSHTYDSQGNYTVTLTVTDAEGAADSVATSFRVKNRGSVSGSTSGSSGGDTGDTSTGSEKGRKKCTDGADNDGDGLIDAADPDCQ